MPLSSICYIMLLKDYRKKLANVEHNRTTVMHNRQQWFDFYFNYFYNIIVNYFTWDGLPDDIDPIYIEKALIETGHIAFFQDDTLGFIVQRGTKSGSLNHYDQPLRYQTVNNTTLSRYRHFGEKLIAYTYKDFIFYDGYKGRNKKDPCVIIPNNNFHEPYIPFLVLFCEKLSDIEMTIQLNRNAQITPFFVLADNTDILSLKNIFNKIASFEPVVYANRKKNKDGEDSFRQISDYLQVFRTEAPYLLDKLHDEKLRVMNQFLSFIGINNNPTEKKERLVVAEAISNNGLISANIEVGWKSRRQAAELINKCYGLNITVKPAEHIQQFNLDKVALDLYGEDGGGVPFDPE